MSKLCPKCQYFVGAPLLSSTALILLGMEFTRAAQVVAGILFHSSIMTSRSFWMLDTWCFSTFRLRMPHMCSIGFRSEIHVSLNELQLPSTSSTHAAPDHDATTTVLDCRQGTIFLVLLTRALPHMLDTIESNKFTLDSSDHRTWFQ